jgi:uncharacterized protein YrzB (UPF0473 family)
MSTDAQDFEAGLEELDEDRIVELTDDEGRTVRFAILLVVELDGHDYVALTPVDQLEGGDEEEQDIYLFLYDEQPGDEEGEVILGFSPIADEDEFRRVEAFCAEQMDLLAGA